jgi:hypothetical protein
MATSGISPTEDKGRVPNVINHLFLRKQGFSLDDLCRLCWLWQWDSTKPSAAQCIDPEEDENPFVENEKLEEKDWCRGSLGIIITPATQFLRDQGKRIAVYGIGIEVEMDIDKGLSDGMNAVARWTADGAKRKETVSTKLMKWIDLHSGENPIPFPPKQMLPALRQASTPKGLSLTQPRKLSSTPSPKKLKDGSVSHLLLTPLKSQTPVKQRMSYPPNSSPECQSRIPFPITPLPKSVQETPSHNRVGRDGYDTLTAKTPSTSDTRTPTSERRSALYERVRQRSLSNTPSTSATKRSNLKEGLNAMSASLLRRRCLLGRLPNIAESIWMYGSQFPLSLN